MRITLRKRPKYLLYITVTYSILCYKNFYNLSRTIYFLFTYSLHTVFCIKGCVKKTLPLCFLNKLFLNYFSTKFTET